MLAKHTRRLVLAGVAVCAVALPLAGSPAYAATGDVLTFGASTFGQLGNGSISATPRPTPVKVLGNATDVAGGREHTLALAGGRVYAWGADNLGAVGDGGTAFTNVVAPKLLTTMTSVDSVATGHYHSLALDRGTNNTVWAWGSNSRGQIGPAGGSSYRVGAPVKVLFPTTGSVSMIAAGRAHSLALIGGRVYAWGDNSSGQLGNGSRDDADHDDPKLVPGLSGVVWIAGGRDSTFAITGTGALWAWGNNAYGQLGLNSRAQQTSPKQVPGTWKQVESGADHTIGLRANGTVESWGRNRYGQLGQSSKDDVLAPKPVPGLAGITFTEVRVGRDHSMAFGGGKFFTWGRNDGGQLGVPPADTPDTQRATPARVTALASARDAGGGQVHTVVALG